MRKLASIQIIKSIESIPNADRIEKITVMGWGVVAKKGEFSVGDKCVYFEVDSILPEKDWCEFLRSRKFRLSTTKLKGVISQGLVMPLSIDDRLKDIEVETDVTELLDVKKYEPAIPNIQEVSGNFISGIPKTDELRVQSIMKILDEIKGKEFYASIKLDGTSGTFGRVDGDFYACSRNWSMKKGNNRYWRMVDKYKLDQILPEGIVLQGEICGPGIQKNKLSLHNEDVFFFTMFKIGEGYQSFDQLNKFCVKHGLKTVPIHMMVVGEEAKNFDHSLEGWLKRAEGTYGRELDSLFDRHSNSKIHLREGLVVRSLKEQISKVTGHRLSFKVINNKFLLKEK